MYLKFSESSGHKLRHERAPLQASITGIAKNFQNNFPDQH